MEKYSRTHKFWNSSRKYLHTSSAKSNVLLGICLLRSNSTEFFQPLLGRIIIIACICYCNLWELSEETEACTWSACFSYAVLDKIASISPFTQNFALGLLIFNLFISLSTSYPILNVNTNPIFSAVSSSEMLDNSLSISHISLLFMGVILKNSLPLEELIILASLFAYGMISSSFTNDTMFLFLSGSVAATPCICLLLSPLYDECSRLAHIPIPLRNTKYMWRRRVTSILTLFITAGALCSYWIYLLDRIEHTNGLDWVFNELIKPHIGLILFWGFVTSVALRLTLKTSKTTLKYSKTELNLLRKIFHFAIVLIITPGVYFYSRFTSIALSLILLMCILLEVVRSHAIWPIGLKLHQLMSPLTNHRDFLGPFFMSHISLLLGVSLPIWGENIIYNAIDVPDFRSLIAQLSGVATLGLGDSLASIIGQLIMKPHYWPGTQKTIEGTVAFFLGCVLFFTPVFPRISWDLRLSIIKASFFSALIEAFCYHNDNFILPLYFWCILRS